MDEKIIKLLEDIKKLLILDLIVRDIQAKDIAEVLDMNKSTITRMVSTRRIKKSS
jgi:DNA-binding transcriptional ArsR family regulator